MSADIKEQIAKILAPAIDARAPYAKVMIDKIAALVKAPAKLHGSSALLQELFAFTNNVMITFRNYYAQAIPRSQVEDKMDEWLRLRSRLASAGEDTTTDWDNVPWTPFVEGELPTDNMPAMQRDRDDLIGVAINSRYQVNLYNVGKGEPFGRVVWLSIKTLDRQPRHDWRDLQRIKNEVVGPEYDAIEIFPAESKLVDTSNQYHLWVFLDYKLPFGFHERAVGDGSWNGSVQRPFPEGWRPADCLTSDDYRRRVNGANVRAALLQEAKKEKP
jgi:hypothetical protein